MKGIHCSQNIFQLLVRILNLKSFTQPMIQVFLKCDLLHILFAEFWQHIGHVAIKHRIRRKKNDLIGIQPISIFVEQISNPLQGGRCLATASCAVNNEHPPVIMPDDQVLLLLNSSYYIVHMFVCTFAKHLL